MEEAGGGGDCNGGNPAAWMGRGGQGRQPAAPFSLNGFLYCPEVCPLSALRGFQGPPDHTKAPTFPLLEDKPRPQESWAGGAVSARAVGRQDHGLQRTDRDRKGSVYSS